MRIEMVVPTLEIGGMERMVVSLATGLAERRHQVGVTCLNASGVLAEELERHSIRVSVVHAPTVLSNFRAPALARHFRSLAPDVVHTHSGAWGRAVRAASSAGVARTIHTIHGRLDRDPWYDIALKRWEMWHTDHVVTVSSELSDDLRQRIGAPETKLSVLINGVDTTVFAPNAAARAAKRAALGFGDALVFGTVARMAPVKNQATLIDAFAELHFTVPNATLVFIGDGPLEHELRARAAQSAAAARIQFLGVHSDTESMYRALDFFVLPSLAEGTSMSLLEAMASQVPAIASPVGGNPRLLDNGECGTLTTGCDIASLLESLQRAVSNMAHTDEMARRARDRVVQEFSRAAMLDGYERLYRREAGCT
jgi:glycosyltransferase involved in cell wall biosynthesis